jgi:hypothetical protein
MNGSVMFVLLGFFQYKLEACLTLHMCFKSFISNTSDIFFCTTFQPKHINQETTHRILPDNACFTLACSISLTEKTNKNIYINTFFFWLHNDLGLTWLSSVRSTVQHPMTKILWNTGAWFVKLIFPLLPFPMGCNVLFQTLVIVQFMR